MQSHVDDQPNLFQSVVGYVGVLLRLERRLLALVVSYSLAIGLFALIVPLTVQELTNTFAFAIQPVTIVTLAGVMIAALLFVGAFRSLQYYAVEVLERRLFARVAIGMAQQIPQFQFLGTGFAVEDGSLIVTNAHVLPKVLDPALRETLAVLIPLPDKDDPNQAQVREAKPVATDADSDS